MTWTVIGAGLVLYECFALTRRRTTISDYSHRFPQGVLIWGWLIGLALHFIRGRQLDEARQA